MHSLVPGFHIWIPFPAAMARSSPDGEKRTQWTGAPQSIRSPSSCLVSELHSFVVQSDELVATTFPSGEKFTDEIHVVWALMACVSRSPLSPCQKMSSPFSSPLAINFPSRDIATPHTQSRCPSIVFVTTPSFKFHRRSVLPDVTIRCPSRKTATASTD